MSDIAESSTHPGTVSPRNVDTRYYRVIRELPITGIAEVNGVFSSWPQGEVFANVSGLGLGPVKNSDIAAWAEEGRIEHLANAPGVAERAPSVAMKPAAGTSTGKKHSAHPSATTARPSRPWTLPGAEGGKG